MDGEAEGSRLKTLYPFVDGTKTPLPSRWNRNDKCHSLSLTEDNIRVRVRGRAVSPRRGSPNRPAVVRSDRPIPAACGVYYFEIHIKDKGERGVIFIGLSQEGAPLDRMPGTYEGSFGYSGENGHIFAGSDSGILHGPTFTTGDVIGCGINFVDNTCFYTKNGQNIGIAFKNIEGIFYITVGLLTMGEMIDANFGRLPFMYNISEEVKDVQGRVQGSIRNFSLPLEKSEWLQTLVSNYLIHHGFAAAAESFNNNFAAQFSKEAKNRQDILKMFESTRTDRFDRAISKVQESYPGLFEQKPELLLALKCQEFVEKLIAHYEAQWHHHVWDNACNSTTPGQKPSSHPRISPKCRRSKIHATSNSLRSSPMRFMSPRPSRRSASPVSTDLVLNGCEKRSSSPEYFDPATSMENGTKNMDCDGVASDHMENGSHKTKSDSYETPMQTEDSCRASMMMFYDASPYIHNGTDGTVDCDMDGDCPMTDLSRADGCSSAQSDGRAVDGSTSIPDGPLMVAVSHDGNCSDSSPGHSSRIERLIAYGRELSELQTQLKQQGGNNALLMTCDQILRDAFNLIAFTDPDRGVPKYRLDPKRREFVLMALNSSMVETHQRPPRSALDTVYAHARRLRTEMAKNGLGAAAFADIS